MIIWKNQETNFQWDDERQNKWTDKVFPYIAIAGIILIAILSVIFYEITGESMNDVTFVSIGIISGLLVIWKLATRAR